MYVWDVCSLVYLCLFSIVGSEGFMLLVGCVVVFFVDFFCFSSRRGYKMLYGYWISVVFFFVFLVLVFCFFFCFVGFFFWFHPDCFLCGS